MPIEYEDGAKRSATPPNANEIIEALRGQILDGKIGAGEWLREVRLCREFGVGRSVIRRALRVLADDGLLKAEQNCGAYVSVPTMQEVFDLYEVRAALYGLAARFACIRSSAAFMNETLNMIDEKIAASERGGPVEGRIRGCSLMFTRLASTGSADTQQMIETVHRKTHWHYSYVGLAESPSRKGPIDHWRVVREALAARDSDRAAQAARDIVYYMQNEAMRLMISRGLGMPSPEKAGSLPSKVA